MVKAKANEIQYMHFTVFDTDGTTPLTGQAGSCTSSLRKNGATTAESVSIGEIGSTGRYYASFTPLAEADYDLEVLCPDDRVMGENWETEVADLDDIVTEVDANETKIDAVKVDTAAILLDTDTMEADLKTHIDTAETNIIAEIDANETKIDLLQVDTTAIIAHLIAIKGAGWVDENLTTINAIVDTLPTAAEIDTELEGSHGAGSWVGVGMTESDLHDGLDNYTNKDDYKADVASLALEVTAQAILSDTDTLEVDLKAYMDIIEDNIRGGDDDDLKDISDQIDAIDIELDTILRILGLVHENHSIDNYSYDGNILLGARIRTYTDAISVGTDNNVLATYIMSATYSGGLLYTYKVVKQ